MKKQKHYTNLEEVNNEIKEDILSFNFDDIDLNIDLDDEAFNVDFSDLDEAIDNMSNRMSRIEDVLARLESRLGTQI